MDYKISPANVARCTLKYEKKKNEKETGSNSNPLPVRK
jgi:hypothetical protein